MCGQTRSQSMGNSQYHRQRYITYHGYSIAYLASPDSSGGLGIIIYFLRRKYPAGKAAKRLICSTGGIYIIPGISTEYRRSRAY